MEEFEKADFCIAITISSNLSGSMNSAVLAKEMVLERYPEKKIVVLASYSTGPEIVICVEKIFDNLVKNGRMSKVAGFVGGARRFDFELLRKGVPFWGGFGRKKTILYEVCPTYCNKFLFIK